MDSEIIEQQALISIQLYGDRNMDSRKRFVETLTFGSPDKVPFMPGSGRESTMERWHKEGLPVHLENPALINDYAYKQVGGTLELPFGGPGFPVKEQMIPEFEKKVIERKQNSQIVQDWKGNICEISNEYTVDYLGGADSKFDFVTRRWIKCPVESWEDWQDMKRRYNSSDTSRMPVNAEELYGKLKDRDYPIEIRFSGPFWQLREWLGFENLCMMFHDDPMLVRDMIEFWTDHISHLLKQALTYVVPDSMYISEDMAYKSFSMVSPAMCKEFLMPCWKRWGQIIRSAGVPIYAIDSDGFIGELIPLWIEAGFNVCDPIEVAAGNDINEFRKEFGRNMAFRGGIDKRCIAEGGTIIEKEIKRLRPVIESGGYIPGCDHGVPHDISWQDFVYYTKLLAKATGWL